MSHRQKVICHNLCLVALISQNNGPEEKIAVSFGMRFSIEFPFSEHGVRESTGVWKTCVWRLRGRVQSRAPGVAAAERI